MAHQVVEFTSSSGHIQNVTYDVDTQELVIVFRGGGRYAYSGVDADTASGFSSADSAGQYFNENVKGKFGFTKA